MEPQQLSQLLIQQSVLFESVFEGLIAIDSDYKITAINQTARRLLNLSQPEPTLIGKRISSVISQEVFFYDAPQTNKKDEIVTFNQIKVIARRMAVILAWYLSLGPPSPRWSSVMRKLVFTADFIGSCFSGASVRSVWITTS